MHDVEPLWVVDMQQITQSTAEVALLWAGFGNDEAGIALQGRPPASPLSCAGPVSTQVSI